VAIEVPVLHPLVSRFELEQAGIPLLRQVGVPVFYKGIKIPMGFRADILGL
jgi:hypothetical protein